MSMVQKVYGNKQRTISLTIRAKFTGNVSFDDRCAILRHVLVVEVGSRSLVKKECRMKDPLVPPELPDLYERVCKRQRVE